MFESVDGSRVGSGRVGVIISSRRIVLVSVVRLLFGVVRRTFVERKGAQPWDEAVQPRA